MNEITWRRVSKRQRCPICERHDWCTIASDGSAAICMRVQSDKPTRNGGWLHRLTGEAVHVPARSMRKTPRPRCEWESMLQRWRRDTRSHQYALLAHTLGLPNPDPLRRLGAAYADRYRAWAFPMVDAERRVIGIRLRAETGRKWSVRGGHEGLFVPDALTGAGPLVICEGPTDTAALLGLDLDVIGRPSCSGGVSHVLQFVKRHVLHVRSCVLFIDPDTPGVLGADRLAQELTAENRRPRIVRPPGQFEDVRAWVTVCRPTRAAVIDMMREAHWWRPQRSET